MSSSEQRLGERIKVGGPATLSGGGASWSGTIKNISHRGVFFESPTGCPDVGVEVTLTSAGGKGIVAEVAWKEENGCGLVLVRPE